MVLSIATLGCVSFSVNTTGAASVEDLEAENAYIAVYMDHMTQLAGDLKAFAPSGDNPGPCNKGGVKQDCYAADARAIETITAMLEALKTINVPPRFVDADRMLRDALAKNVEGLQLRNQALQTGDDETWTKHTSVLEEAQTAWTAAYAAFPADHRPPLGP
jgi:hypothetical protein